MLNNNVFKTMHSSLHMVLFGKLNFDVIVAALMLSRICARGKPCGDVGWAETCRSVTVLEIVKEKEWPPRL